MGININSQFEQNNEIKIKIEMASKAFIKYKSMFTNRNLGLHIRLRFLEHYLWSLLLYEISDTEGTISKKFGCL